MIRFIFKPGFATDYLGTAVPGYPHVVCGNPLHERGARAYIVSFYFFNTSSRRDFRLPAVACSSGWWIRLLDSAGSSAQS